MLIVHAQDALPESHRGGAFALGNFDGVHRGHRAVFDAARAAGAADGRKWGVITFEPHPRSVLRPDDAPFRLTSWRTKAEALADLGADMAVVIPFDRALARTPPDAFASATLGERLGARHIAVGEDFRFGQGRAGSAALLASAGADAGFRVHAVPPVLDAAGEPLSSTAVRAHLQAGAPERAAEILGRPWVIDGVVQTGHQRGRTIGFPTANLPLGDFLEPALGVYAVRVGIAAAGSADGPAETWVSGVANIGRRPTVDGQTLLLEAHLFDYSGDLYGRRVLVQLIAFVRAERKFDGLDALKAQIATDSDTARRMMEAGN